MLTFKVLITWDNIEQIIEGKDGFKIRIRLHIAVAR